MAYSTVAQIRTRLPRLTEAVQSNAVVEEFIADADSEIDAALGALYTVPFSPVPRVIQTLSKDLAAARCVRQYLSKDNVSASQPWIVEALANGARMEDMLREGKFVIIGASGTLASIPQVFSSTFSADGRLPALRNFDGVNNPDRMPNPNPYVQPGNDFERVIPPPIATSFMSPSPGWQVPP